MERLTLRVNAARKALASLEQLLQTTPPSDVERDASIQRFEYTCEAVWKAAKHYLREVEGVDAASPKSVIRSCREVGVLDENDAIRALELIDDRNLTSHTYNESLAKQIYGRLNMHARVLRRWLEHMEERIWRQTGDR